MATPPPNPPAEAPTPPRFNAIVGHLIGIVLISAAAGYMLHAGWDRWNDAIVDFGRELYLPWQITQGKVLYRDLATFNGPLSPYVNALWFKLSGVGLHTLIYWNLAITAAIVAMIYRLIFLTAGLFAAIVSCLAFIFLCAFSQYGIYGNENYLAPYSHEATHGVALSLAAVLLFHRFLKTNRTRWLAGAGAVLGLIFLTKVEVFVAASGAVFAGIALHAWLLRTPIKRVAVQVAITAAALLIPPLIAFSLLALAMPAHDAFLGVLGSFRHSFNSDLTVNLYFKTVSGLGDPWASFEQAIHALLKIVIFLLPPVLIARFLRGSTQKRMAAAAFVFAVAASVVILFFNQVEWQELPRALSLYAAITLIGEAISLVLLSRHRRTSPADTLWLVFVAFSLAMLLKMILNVRLNHYGFTLAMPALIVFTATVTGRIPRHRARDGGDANVLRAAAVAGLAGMVVFHVHLSNANHAALTDPIGQGADRFYYWHERAHDVNLLLDLLRDHTGPNDTLAVMPEGVMINFLLRRENPTPYTFFVPTDVIMFGEGKIVLALEHRPPDYVALIHKDTSQYGVQFFGRDYARTLYQWLVANYHPVGKIGPPPFQSDEFGISVLKKNDKR